MPTGNFSAKAMEKDVESLHFDVFLMCGILESSFEEANVSPKETLRLYTESQSDLQNNKL